VHVPTLTGLGERSHLAHLPITLSTHIDDVANEITFNDLADVVLVMHAYGGLVGAGIAELRKSEPVQPGVRPTVWFAAIERRGEVTPELPAGRPLRRGCQPIGGRMPWLVSVTKSIFEIRNREAAVLGGIRR
jgi:hypothetical protein